MSKKSEMHLQNVLLSSLIVCIEGFAACKIYDIIEFVLGLPDDMSRGQAP